MISEQRISAQNEINLVANEIDGHLVRLLSEWINLKARKVSGYGGFVKKLSEQLDQYNESHSYNKKDGNWWLNVHASYTSIIATVRNLNTAQKIDIYLGRFDDKTGVLTRVEDVLKRKTDYTLEDVQGWIKKATELENQAQQLRGLVRDFNIR
jgi:hypothetical protein